MLRKVRSDVREKTGGSQRTGNYDQLESEIFLAGPGVGNSSSAIAMGSRDSSTPLASSGLEDGFVLVRGGTFQMGSTSGENDEKPVHSVTASSFYIGKYEVTVDNFRTFVNETGYKTNAEKDGGAFVVIGSKWEKKSDANWRNPYMNQTSNDPVTCVSWYDAVEYCNWLKPKRRINKSLQWKRR